MRLAELVKRLGDSVGLTVFRDLPRGIDVCRDLKFAFRGHDFATLFDVGANVGQSALAMARAFPGAEIHCFEPASDSFALLERNTAALPAVYRHRAALGDVPGSASLVRTDNITMRHLDDGSSASTDALPTETVAVTTLSQFCREKAVRRIDYLKIDTEGYDLKVLGGAAELLERQAIAVVQCEAGLDPDNDFHVSFDAVRQALHPAGYRLFGLYQQKPRESHALRRVNAVFASADLLRRHPRKAPA